MPARANLDHDAGSTFLYASGVFGVEFFFLFVYLALELARIFQASKGNKVEQIGPLLWSVVLSVGVVILHVFFFNMQTYVLKVDRILNGMGIVFIALESLLMLLTSLTFYRERQ
mmetsp:Transcript_21674/g.69193  ORF Transcript_21674/g.69193 Transcript_21674/m.69193 type:complete len:114 (-) Transcript_21674:694-1035(-)